MVGLSRADCGTIKRMGSGMIAIHVTWTPGCWIMRDQSIVVSMVDMFQVRSCDSRALANLFIANRVRAVTLGELSMQLVGCSAYVLASCHRGPITPDLCYRASLIHVTNG